MASVTLEIPDELMVKLKKQSSDVGHEPRLAAAFSLCRRAICRPARRPILRA